MQKYINIRQPLDSICVPRWTLACGLATLLACLTGASAHASEQEETPKINREIFVPFEDLDVLLDRNSNRVMLDRDEYEKILEAARTREIKRAPQESLIVEARYEGQVVGGIAIISGTLVVEPLNEGLVAVPLSLSGVALRDARLDNQPAKLWRDEQGKIVLLLSGKGRQTLTLEMTVPMQTTAAIQSMALQLPAPGASTFRLTVPGNVEVKSGLSVVNRNYQEEKNETQLDLLIGREPASLVMSLNNRLLKDERVVVARSVLIHKLALHEHQMHVTCSLDVIHGAVDQVQFKVPDGYMISQATTPLLSQWEILPEESGNILSVQLREATRDDVVLNIVAARSVNQNEPENDWLAPNFRPLDVAGYVAVVGILVDVNLQTENIRSRGVIPIDHEFLTSAIPETTLTAGFTNPVSIVAAYYAPQADYSIEARFVAPSPRLVVKSNSRLVIDDSDLELQGGISMLSAFDSRFGFDIELPAPWRFTEITGVDGKAIPFERSQSGQSTRAYVRLPGKISSTEPTRVYFKARATPANWLDLWQENKIDFPVLKVPGASAHTGAVAVSINSDVRVMLSEIVGLETLDDQDKQKFELQNESTPLAFRFMSDDYSLALRLERLEPSISARTYTFYSIKPTQLVAHSELVFDVKRAKTDTFRFQLSKSSPASVSIRGIDHQLKDYFSAEMETARAWTVQLSSATAGTVKLVVDFRQPLDEQQLAELVLTPVAADNVQFQSSMLAVEGSSELDIELATSGRAVDIGELSEASYQPGRFMLGAYSWPSENGRLTVKSTRRPIYALPGAIVQRAEMVTSVSANGQAQTAARFQLVTKLPFLRIQLPPDSSLWSLQLDGKPAKPLVDKNTLLVSLYGTESATLRDLQMVYQSSVDSIGLVGRIETQAPTLWLQESADDQGLAVPLADLQWRMVLPDGYQVSHVDANFQSSQLAARPTLIQQFGIWLYTIGGGIERNQGLVAASPSAQTATGLDLYGSDQMAPGRAKGFRDRAGEDDSMALDEVEEARQRMDDLKRGKEEKQPNAAAEKPSSQASVPADSPSDPGDDVSFPERAATRQWALSGLRSLNIELTETGNSIDFTSLGEQPRIEATVANAARITWLAVAVALLIGLVGVLLTHRPTSTKVLFVIAVILFTGLFPLTGWFFDAFRPVADLSLLAAIMVGLYFIVAAALVRFGKSAKRIAVQLPILLLTITLTIAVSQNTHAQQVVNDTDQLLNLIERVSQSTPVKLPADAIIIPFDASEPDGRAKARRLLLPYEHYLQLINKSADRSPDDSLPPVDFVLSSAQYSTRLTLDENLTVNGKIAIELLTDKPVAVALPLAGGALAEARVNGQPAKLQFALEPDEPKQGAAKGQDKSAPSSIVLLHLEGRGIKTLEFTVRLSIKRQGGWRSMSARLPVGMTRALNLTSLDQDTEIRLSSDADQRTIQARSGEKIETVLSSDGTLRLQWKPSAATTSIDQSLTAESEAIFDIREDGLRLSWRVGLDFRGSERDSFTLNIPDGYLVERVAGENIRAWDVQKNDDAQQLTVRLLSAARDSESFLVELSQRDFSVSDQTLEIETPYLSVTGAALDRGVLTIRRSPVIELKTLDTKSASRIDLDPAQCQIDILAIDSNASPLGITTYQSLRFVATPFTIRLAANLLAQSVKADTQTILRVGQSEADYEMRINYNVGPRPIYELSFDLPKGVEIDQITAGQNESWSSEKLDNAVRVHLFLPRGVKGDFSVFVDGSLPNYTGGPSWDIPTIKIDGAESQNGQIAVQVDPALQVTTENLQDCQTVLLSRLHSWLNPDQRGSSRLALRTQGGDYRATLKFSEIQPRITVETVTNVRLTYFAIEETILLDFNIQQAGIRQIKFLLPDSMKNARIRAQLVSETTMEPAAAPYTDMIQVTLDLQDEVMDSYRVVIENDRGLEDKNQSVPIPVVVIGETMERYATLQNAGRDEIAVQPTSDFQPLNRQLNQYANLKQKLGGGQLTMAYLAKQDVPRPQLSYGTTWRQTIDTVEASIEFSKTIMVVDAGGAYRAVQTFQVNNRSEQYLDIELPAGARLLTVWVEGAPVKPVSWPSSGNDRQLRIPLVKTPAGDLDYPVQLKYAGELGELAMLKKIEFPVVQTLNINVQLSQLQLKLPESYQWINFDGTMTRVDSQGGLEQGYLSYKRQQIQRLAEQLQNEAQQFGSFSKSRALKNLGKLSEEMSEYENIQLRGGIDVGGVESKTLESQVFGNREAIRVAQQAAELSKDSETTGIDDNRYNFNELLVQQQLKLGRNAVIRQGKNWKEKSGFVADPAEDEAQKKQKFDSEWFARNKLESGKMDDGRRTRIQAVTEGTMEGKPGGQPQNGQQLQTDAQAGAEIMLLEDSISYANPAETTLMVDKDAKLPTLNEPDFATGGRIVHANDGESRFEGWQGIQGEPTSATGLASLSIELPERGVDFFFKSPRGNARVIARAVPVRSITSWLTALVAIVSSIVIWVGWRISHRLGQVTFWRIAGLAIVLLFGLLSVALGLLPVFGLIALLAATAIVVEFALGLIVSQKTVSNLP